ncbi:GNAT family N-acetyltransferase [Barrientosiimonas humi]|uniref:GNAT family N-acetyltransferase n=1 Tax=Barrientosiimonas humi TaxID=999931 RepID=UPI00370D5883
MSSPPWTVRPVPYLDPVAQELVAELDRDMQARYGGQDATPVDPEHFADPSGTFLVMEDGAGPIGCAGIRTHGADAEIKRMYVRASRRRRGFARHLLTALEAYARARGFTRVILETGTAQPEAIALYEASGYVQIVGYGYYRDEPTCRCYAKWLI